MTITLGTYISESLINKIVNKPTLTPPPPTPNAGTQAGRGARAKD